jgi:hypothetical protein
MRRYTALLLGFFVATPLLAQEAREPLKLDSGTIVRLQWADGREKARLLAPFRWDSALVRYCRYPSPVCGESTLNPPRMRPVGDLRRVEVRRGSRTGRGALIGAGFGTLGGLLVLHTRGLSDAPALSRDEQILTLAVMAATWSALGALIGAASDNWAPAPSDPGLERPNPRMQPTGRQGAESRAGGTLLERR